MNDDEIEKARYEAEMNRWLSDLEDRLGLSCSSSSNFDVSSNDLSEIARSTDKQDTSYQSTSDTEGWWDAAGNYHAPEAYWGDCGPNG